MREITIQQLLIAFVLAVVFAVAMGMYAATTVPETYVMAEDGSLVSPSYYE